MSLAIRTVALALSLACAPAAHACFCSPAHVGESPIEARNRSAAVFQGQLLDEGPVPGLPGLRAVTFAVQRSWKGVTTTRVVVHTEESSAACGVDPPFDKTETYLVYAIWNLGVYDDPSVELVTGLCTRTRLLEDAQEDLVALGPASSLPLHDENWSTIKARF